MAKHRKHKAASNGVRLASRFLLIVVLSLSLQFAEMLKSNDDRRSVGVSGSAAQSTDNGSDVTIDDLPRSNSGRLAYAQPKRIYYTVRPGDNLSKIADAFKLLGYEPLYGWNSTVIGHNPDLIRPGQRLVIVVRG